MRILLILIFVAIVVSKQDYYSILGLKKGAPQDQVKKQFRKLSLKYHPDKNKHPQAESKYKEITHAYQQIMDGKTEDEDNIPPPRYSQSTFTFHGDPFAQHHYYQSYQTYTRTSQNSGYYGEAFLYILVLIFLLLIFNFIRGQVGDQQQSQQQQEQQQQQQQQQQQYKTQQQHSSQEQTNPFQSRKDIKEKVSNVSSYTESDHRFKFHENFKE